MPRYFLDTSALAKLYHSEIGSEYMDRILKETGSQFVISRLSIVEMESVLATKVRTREIDQAGVDIGRRSLRTDLVRGRLIVGSPDPEMVAVRRCVLQEASLFPLDQEILELTSALFGDARASYDAQVPSSTLDATLCR